MTRLMYDSVIVSTIPKTATLVAGYIDGHYANVNAMKAAFPHATVVQIAVFSHTDAGHVLDVETGDATPAESVSWVQMRRRAGADPTVYCNTSVLPQVIAAFKSAGVAQPHYWIAHWDNSPTIPAGAVAKQYANPTLTGHEYDLSSVVAYWPGVDPKPVITKPPVVIPAFDPSKEAGFPVWHYRNPIDGPDAWALLNAIAKKLGVL
jgi:hypothetical protein